MQQEKKYLKNILNADDADFSVGQDQVINSENVRFGSTDAGIIGTIESIGSTILLSQPQSSVSTVVIGNADDSSNSRIIYFVADLYGNDDKILCYDLINNITYTVILSSQVIGGLNLDKNSVIHSARVVGKMLYWVDGVTNEPRKINVDSGIKLNHPGYSTTAIAYVSPLDWREITLIKPPPPLAPNIIKNTDSGFENNFIANESFMFAFQYVYYDNEISVVGTYSNASRLNSTTDTFNQIIVTMDQAEMVPQTVRIVNLIVRYGNSAFIINTWDKLIPAQNLQIINQNSGSQPLLYNFYNNITGEAISADLILKPYDSVPIYSNALEVAKDRMFLGNNTEGYDAPMTTSLSFALGTTPITGDGISVQLIEGHCNGSLGNFQKYSGWFVYLDFVSPAGFYSINGTDNYQPFWFAPGYPPLPPAPTTVAFSGLTFRGADETETLNSINTQYGASMFIFFGVDSSDFVTITGLSVSAYNIFKGQSQYNIGVSFYDYAMRKCGVVAGTLVTIPAREFEMTEAVNGIIWSLSNSNAFDEIPEWAHYYSVVRTLNLRTRYFLQAIQTTSSAKYATKNTDGVYEFNENDFVFNAVGIGLDTTSMVQAGLGYSFSEGDVCYLIKDDNSVYTLSVIGQAGKYIIVNVPAGGIGDLTTFEMVYEIYTPYQASTQEPFYEIGEMYQILNPRTGSRAYGTTSGAFLPDAYALSRSFNSVTYFAETMSPNDRFFSRWDNDSGKVNFIVKSGQVIKTQSISFSNTFIPGTATNGLSTFEALNESNVPLENGAIQKLILTSKTQDQGDVMLSICENETTSIYLGETQILDSTGATQFTAISNGVIGTKNNLKGAYGTINPESVVEFKGNVYWVDLRNGKVVQYSANGLFPISNYKMTRFWKLFSDQFMSMSRAQIESLGNRPFIFSSVDPHHWELLISVPKLLNTPPKGKLPDYQFINYPFDIYDGQAKTLKYKLNEEPNHWQGAIKFCAEGFVSMMDKLFSFKNGQLYLHNSTSSQCVFYGTQERARVMFLSNIIPEVPKTYNNITIQANMKPVFTYLYNDYPYQQSSDLISGDFRSLEGVFYSPIYRNKLTPTTTGYDINGLLTGDKIRTEALKIMLEFDVSQNQLELKFVDIGFTISTGHSTLKK